MTREASKVLINKRIFLYRDKAPFVPSGKSVMGALEYDEVADSLKCHECGEWFHHLGSHVVMRHGMLADAYRERHGLRRTTSLISRCIRRKKSSLGSRDAINLERRGRKTRLKKGQSARVKTGIDHEKRNIRGSCKAQMTESIIRLARFVGRTPTITEAAKYGVNHTRLRDRM